MNPFKVVDMICGILGLGGTCELTIIALAGCCSSIWVTATHPTFFYSQLTVPG